MTLWCIAQKPHQRTKLTYVIKSFSVKENIKKRWRQIYNMVIYGMFSISDCKTVIYNDTQGKQNWNIGPVSEIAMVSNEAGRRNILNFMIKQSIFSISQMLRCAINIVWMKNTYKIVSSVREVFVATDASISPPHFTNILVIKIYSQSCIMCLCMVITSTKVSIKMLKTCKYKNDIRLSKNSCIHWENI